MEQKKITTIPKRNNKIIRIREQTDHIIKKLMLFPCVDGIIKIPKKGFFFIQRFIQSQKHQGASVNGRIQKYGFPEEVCADIGKKEIGSNIDINLLLGFLEFQDANDFISLNFRALFKNHTQKIYINKNEISDIIMSFNITSDIPEQFMDIRMKLRRDLHE